MIIGSTPTTSVLDPLGTVLQSSGCKLTGICLHTAFMKGTVDAKSSVEIYIK